MTSTWQILAGNFAAVALIVSIWMHLSYRLYRLSATCQKSCLGLALGSAAVASMLLSVEFESGIYFDLRLALVQAAAVFGGPWTLMITASLAVVFRLVLGGAGAVAGVIAIFIVSFAGLALWLVLGKRPLQGAIRVITAAVVQAALSIGVLVLLPQDLFFRALQQVAIPFAILNFLATASMGFFVDYFRRFTLERDILYAALTQAPDYHYVKDLEHRFLATNLNVARYHGRERSSEMIGLTDFDLTSVERAEALRDGERDVLATGRPIDHFEEHLVEDGKEPRWFSTSKVPLRNRQGDLIGLAGVTVDITEKKILEQELRASRNVMARAMAEMSDGLAMFGADGKIVFCNEQYRALFPRSAYARRQGAHISDIIRATIRNGERADLPIDLDEERIQAAAQTLRINKDEIIPLSDGRWLSLRTRVAEDHTVLALVSDITALKESELSCGSWRIE